MARNNSEVEVIFKAQNKDFNDAMKGMNQESKKLRQEMKLQEEQMKLNANDSEKLQAKLQNLSQQYAVAQRATQATAEHLQRAKALYGENSAEVAKLETRLRSQQIAEQQLQNQISTTNRSLQEQQNATKQLKTFFDATGTSVDHFANALGNNLTNAIRNGTATARQLEQALDLIGREALGAETDIEKLQRALRSVDDGNSIENVRNELRDLSREAERAEHSLKGLDIGLENLLGGLMAGGGIAGVIEQALDTSKLKTKIDVTFEVPASSKKSVEEAVRGVEAYGVDVEEALEGTRRQWALNKTVSDKANASIVKGAGAISSAYAGIDFTELIQETNEIGNELGITNDTALGLTNRLLNIGFPPEQLDIIAEYGGQLTRAGYNAEEVQAIMEAGVETGTWNIDNLLDGLKEGRIKAAEFGQGVDKSMREALEGTKISADQLEKWGQSVTKGGKEGSAAMTEIAKALADIEDETKRNEIGVKLFGTMYEDQGQNITNTLIGAQDKVVDLNKNQEQLNEMIKKMDASPAVKLQKALADLKMALEPVLATVASVIAAFATWVSSHPALAAAITTIVVALGILVGAAMALGPVFISLASYATYAQLSIGAVATSFFSVIGIIIGVIAIIAALVVGIRHLWQTNESFRNACINAWETIKNATTTAIEAMKNALSSFGDFLGTIPSKFSAMGSAIGSLVDSIKSKFGEIGDAIGNSLQSKISSLSNVFSGLGSAISPIIEFIKSSFSSIGNTIATLTPLIVRLGLTFLGVTGPVGWVIAIIASLGATIFKLINTNDQAKEALMSAWQIIQGVFTSIASVIMPVITSLAQGFIDAFAPLAPEFQKTGQVIMESFASLQPVFAELGTAFGELGSTIISLFGEVVTGIMPLAADLFKLFGETVQQVMPLVTDLIKLFTDTTIELMPLITGVVQELVQMFSGLAAEVMPMLAQVVQEVFPVILNVIQASVGIWIVLIKTFADIIVIIVQEALPIFLTIFQQVFPIIVSIVQTTIPIVIEIVKLFGEVIRIIATTVIPLILQVVQAVFPVIMAIIQAIIPIISAILQGMAEVIKGVLIPAIQFILSIVQAVFPTIMSVISSVLGIITNVIKLFTSILKGDWSGAWEAVKGITSSVMSLIGSIIQGAMSLIGTVVSGGLNLVSSIFSSVLNAVWGVVKSIFSGISNVISSVMSAVGNIISAGWNAVSSVTSSILDAVFNTVSNVWDNITSFLSGINLMDIGRNIMEGLLNGISSMVNRIWDKITETASGIKDRITSALGIHSPSRWMRDMVGVNLGKGLVIGMDKMKTSVQNAASKMAEWSKPDIDGSVSYASAIPQSLVNSVTNQPSITLNLYGTVREEADIRKLAVEVRNELTYTQNESAAGIGRRA
ncbi:hypothetical protein ABDI32_06565 [Bacillus wiedmannii]|uniref:hypothetical protein n=1 Tax=Bacillus wiedmannii TaxID=1890302 RepID=UPI003D2607EA